MATWSYLGIKKIMHVISNSYVEEKILKQKYIYSDFLEKSEFFLKYEWV